MDARYREACEQLREHTHPRYCVVSMGCGYFRPCTRADAFGKCEPIAPDRYPGWGFLYHEAVQEIVKAEN